MLVGGYEYRRAKQSVGTTVYDNLYAIIQQVVFVMRK